MAPGEDALDAFRSADAAYQHALEELDALKYARDQALLQAQTDLGCTVRELAVHVGLSAPRVQQILQRARDTE